MAEIVLCFTMLPLQASNFKPSFVLAGMQSWNSWNASPGSKRSRTESWRVLHVQLCPRRKLHRHAFTLIENLFDPTLERGFFRVRVQVEHETLMNLVEQCSYRARGPKPVGLSRKKCSSVVILVMFPDYFPTKRLQQANHGRREKTIEN